MNKTERKTKRTTGHTAEAAEEAKEDGQETDEADVSSEGAIADELLDLDQIKDLIELVAAKDFTEFELQRGRFRLRLLRGVRASDGHSASPSPNPGPAGATAGPVPSPPAPGPVEEVLHIVTSPIVGTYYNAPSPTSEPYAGVGDKITSGQTLCIIEAMKLMNEIQSDASGIVAKMFVENGQPVEFGQPLFGIRT
ncbi:MAG: acetyl-CoA carboxylase biotin carboxyl carrier protein [Acidobacteriota bacterium]